MISIQEGTHLASYTSLKIGGPARFFTEAGTNSAVEEAFHWAKEHAVPVAVLGAGSNVLIADTGFAGLLIHVNMRHLSHEGELVSADAGVLMAQVAAYALRHNLTGFEWAAGIPGTIGGSVYGNAGCFGGEMKDVVESVSVFDSTNSTNPASPAGRYQLPTTDCAFAYRESIFKKRKDWIILGATLKLKRISDEEKKQKQADLRRIMRERAAEQAIGERTMGSTFKGIPLTKEVIALLRSYDGRFSKAAQACWVFESRRGMISAGFLIEQAGLKRKKIGGVSVSEKHANFLVNDGAATAEHAVMLIAFIKEYVHRKFGIMLEEEIQYIGM